MPEACFHTCILIYACFVAEKVHHSRTNGKTKKFNLLKINVGKPWATLHHLFLRLKTDVS